MLYRLLIAAAGALAACLLCARPVAAQSSSGGGLSPDSVTLRGEVRLRPEWERPVGVPGDFSTLMRTRLLARAALPARTAIVVHVQDSRALGSATPASRIELHEGYAELALSRAAAGTLLRAGRQEIALGNERLIGRGYWTNTGRAFDGVRLLGGGAWRPTLFAATVEERGRRFGPAAAPGTTPPPDQMVAGAFVSRDAGRALLEGTLVHDRGMRSATREVTSRTTLDSRLVAPRTLGLRLELEGAYQLGRQRALATPAGAAPARETISAWLLGARVGRPQPAAGTTPRVPAAWLGVDVLSGDERADDDRAGAFHTLYATNHPFYGLMDLFGDPGTRTAGAGLTDMFASATVALRGPLTLRTDAHRMSSSRDGALFGWEADAVASHRLQPRTALELGYGAFIPAAAGERIGLGPRGSTRHWAYLQLLASF